MPCGSWSSPCCPSSPGGWPGEQPQPQHALYPPAVLPAAGGAGPGGEPGREGRAGPGAIVLSVFCDWALLAPVFTLLFAWRERTGSRGGIAFAVSILLFGGLNLLSYLERLSLGQALLWTLSAISGQVLAAVCVLFLYNGPAGPAGPGLLQVVLLRFLPAPPAYLGRAPAPDRLSTNHKSAPRIFSGARGANRGTLFF